MTTRLLNLGLEPFGFEDMWTLEPLLKRWKKNNLEEQILSSVTESYEG